MGIKTDYAMSPGFIIIKVSAMCEMISYWEVWNI